MNFGLDVNVDDFILLEGGNDDTPGHLGDAYGTAVAVCYDCYGERDAVTIDTAELVTKSLLGKVEGLL